MRKVLVLNQDYSPLTVCSAERAFILIYSEKAELVHIDPELELRTVSTSFPMPSVIRLQQYIYVPFRGVVLSRQNILKRDQHKCQYCGTPKDLTLDHVIPKSRGGASSWQNLVAACKRCNATKGSRTPEEAEMPLRIKPFRPSYLLFVRNFSGVTTQDWYPYLSVN